MFKAIGRVIASAILLVLTAMLVAVANFAGDWFFPLYTDFSRKTLATLAAITAPFPFAVWEVLALLLLLWAVYTLVQALRHGRPLRWLSGLLLGCSIGIFLFVALWGLNHYAPPLSEQIGLEVRQYSTAELTEATNYYLQQANKLSEKVKRDSDGLPQFDDFRTLASRAGDGYAILAQDNAFFSGSTARIKRLTAWPLFSQFGITGIFVDFTGESCVNPDTFVVSLPFTMCHELGHRMPVAAEEEANFCAYLACSASGDIQFQYSGAYSAFIYCYNSLYKANPDAAVAVWANASAALRADCMAANAHYAQYEGKVQDAAQQVNDVYLKTFSEDSGVQSYGEVTDLLVAWYQQNYAPST